MNIPLSCFIALDNDDINQTNHHLLFRLSCALFEHQKRWKAIQISLPFALVEELEETRLVRISCYVPKTWGCLKQSEWKILGCTASVGCTVYHP